VVYVGVRGNPSEDALFTELFYNRQYNHLSHPVLNLTETTHVQLGLVLQKIVQVVCNYVSLLCSLLSTCLYKRLNNYITIIILTNNNRLNPDNHLTKFPHSHTKFCYYYFIIINGTKYFSCGY